MKTIIAGTRTCTDPDILLAAIAQAPFDVTSVVCGMATGADTLGERYAIKLGLKIRYFPANWTAHGKAAGPIRNKQMVDNADAVIALWDGVSLGTLNLINQAQEAGLEVFVYDYSKVSKEALDDFLYELNMKGYKK